MEVRKNGRMEEGKDGRMEWPFSASVVDLVPSLLSFQMADSRCHKILGLLLEWAPGGPIILTITSHMFAVHCVC